MFPFILIFSLLFVNAVLAAPTTQSIRRTQLSFTERSPQSNIDVLLARLQIDLSKHFKPKDAQTTRTLWQYDLSQQKFDLVVPPSYNRNTPHGLFIWLGNCPVSDDWLNILAAHQLIYVSPVDGHNRVTAVQAGLALDAVHNLRKRFTVNKERVYVAGFSAGAQRAAWVLRAYPEIFRGGVFMMGGWFYITDVHRDGWWWDQHKVETDGEYSPYAIGLDPQWRGPLDRLKTQISIVLVRAEADDWFGSNIKSERAQYEGLRLDGFTRAHYIEIPGSDHVPPNPETFAKAVAALQAAPIAPPTTAPTKSATLHPDQLAQAQRLLTTAQRGLNMHNLLQKLIRDYPASPLTPIAQRGLDWVNREEHKPARSRR
ncbi:MAG TPA: hypothetical protein VF669_21420 [Tepidisphaeraceae bacterium]|jgi:pimeloyl-ACP methyl ester carboxylesterase